MSKSKHVVPNSSGGWSVRTSGASRATRIFPTRDEAVEFGRTAAKANGTELYIHGRDGTIREKRSYGSDPFPPKG